MAHNIQSMAYAGARPWHGLGVKVPGLMKTSEALKAAELDWELTKEPMTVTNEHGMFDVPDHYAIQRSDNQEILGVVGNRYEIIQNRDSFAFFDDVLGQGQGQIETAASLGRGEKVFMMARLPNVTEIVKGDAMEEFLLVHTSHDGSSNLGVIFTNVRVVCQNTLSMAIGSAKNQIKIRHTTNYEERMEEAQRTIIESRLYWDKVVEASKHLAATSVTRVEVGVFMDAMFPMKTDAKKKTTANVRTKFLELVENGQGTEIPGVRGTAWGLYNAYTEYLQYEKTIKGLGKDATDDQKAAQRWERIALGSFGNDMQKAFDEAMKIAA